MPWYGNYPEHLSVDIHGDATDMSTAIFRMYLDDGFVIAADGRQTKGLNDEPVSDGIQKIFPIHDDNKQLGYSMCGTHLFTTNDGSRVIWDLHEEVEKAVLDPITRRSSSLEGYATRLSRPIYRALETAKRTGEIESFLENMEKVYPRGKTIADLHIDGYYSRVPSRVTIRFFHVEQQLQHPSIFLDRDIKRLDLYGSPRIWTVFDDTNDKRLAPYRPKGYSKAVRWDLRTTTKIAAGYIAACSSPQGKEIDENAHRIIGGHTHIAIVTPEGFRWAKGYEPMESPTVLP